LSLSNHIDTYSTGIWYTVNDIKKKKGNVGVFYALRFITVWWRIEDNIATYYYFISYKHEVGLDGSAQYGD